MGLMSRRLSSNGVFPKLPFHILKLDSFYTDEKRAYLPGIFYLIISLVLRSHNFKQSKTLLFIHNPHTRWLMAAITWWGTDMSQGLQQFRRETFFPTQLRTPSFLGPTCLLATLIKGRSSSERANVLNNRPMSSLLRCPPEAPPHCPPSLPRPAVCFKNYHGDDNLQA